MSLWEKVRKLIEIESSASHVEEANAAEEKNELTRQIIEDVISNPGQMICVDDPNLVNEAIQVVNKLWASVSDKQLWEEIRYGQLGSEIQVSFSERAKKLRPTFIARMPSPEVRAYYAEAMAAWLRGLDGAALILCCSIVERLVKQALLDKDPRLVFDFATGRSLADLRREKDFEELLRSARDEGILTEQCFRNADGIRRLRNRAVHELQLIDAEDAIHDTKTIIESLQSVRPRGR